MSQTADLAHNPICLHDDHCVRRGKVVRVRGSVVDIRFDHGMPNIKNALRTGDEKVVN